MIPFLVYLYDCVQLWRLAGEREAGMAVSCRSAFGVPRYYLVLARGRRAWNVARFVGDYHRVADGGGV